MRGEPPIRRQPGILQFGAGLLVHVVAAGGGVHGLCGFFAARAALSRAF